MQIIKHSTHSAEQLYKNREASQQVATYTPWLAALAPACCAVLTPGQESGGGEAAVSCRRLPGRVAAVCSAGTSGELLNAVALRTAATTRSLPCMIPLMAAVMALDALRLLQAAALGFGLGFGHLEDSSVALVQARCWFGCDLTASLSSAFAFKISNL